MILNKYLLIEPHLFWDSFRNDLKMGIYFNWLDIFDLKEILNVR